MQYTEEQKKIFNVCCNQLKNNEIASITAPAGSGKTSTLVELAKQMPNEKILYLAYNKSIAEESRRRFPKNVTVVTIHGLAYKELNIQQEMLRNDYTALEVQEMFDCSYEEADATLKFLNMFFNSKFKNFNQNTIKENKSLYRASVLWNKILNKEIKTTHSAYLKEFQCKQNKAMDNYDVVLLDEAQDSNPVSLSIFEELNGKKILVGDPHQAIYGFRGTVNAMESINANYKLYLTYCFRCCEDVVQKANNVLQKYKKDAITIISKAQYKDEINSRAIITRTNSKIVELLAKNLKASENALINYALIKEPESIFAPAINVLSFILNVNGETKENGEQYSISREYSFLNNFKTKDELIGYIEETDNIELKTAFNLAVKYKKMIFLLLQKAKESYKQRKKEDVVYLMTAHTSKGLEYDFVRLENDFPNIDKMIETKSKTYNEIIEEINLYYVAITRAKYQLIDQTRNIKENE